MSGLPPCVIVRSKLYNHFIGLLQEGNVSFPSSEVNSSGGNFTKAAVDCLCYVDRHHDTLQKQSCPILQLFQIKKCGSESCGMCRPVRLPKEDFDQLHFLQDPVPGDDGHYKAFKDLLGTKMDRTHRPSLQKASKRIKTLPLSASVQHVKNVDTMLQCDECGKWRLLYCRFKLSKKGQADLQTALHDASFTFGNQLQDLELPGRLNEVYTQKMRAANREDVLFCQVLAYMCVLCNRC